MVITCYNIFKRNKNMSKDIVSFILAGGKGTRLSSLTRKRAKPAISFAARYRIIDFPLSNLANSGFDTVSTITQYESIALNSYIGNGEKWGLNGCRSISTVISPRQTEEGASWFFGTADAIYQNIDYLEKLNPENVLILSGDHIYRMSYNDMLNFHKKRRADLTICSIEVAIDEASRFGIINADKTGRVVGFEEKPKEPKSRLASMGIYIFKFDFLKRVLIEDHANLTSTHDFGKDIIPHLIQNNSRVYTYRYDGYWRDVGTLKSLHDANLDIIDSMHEFSKSDDDLVRHIYTEDTHSLPAYIGKNAIVDHSLINQGAIILGTVRDSVISNEVLIEKGAFVDRCIIMNDVTIEEGARIYDAIVAPHTIIKAHSVINESRSQIILYTDKDGDDYE